MSPSRPRATPIRPRATSSSPAKDQGRLQEVADGFPGPRPPQRGSGQTANAPTSGRQRAHAWPVKYAQHRPARPVRAREELHVYRYRNHRPDRDHRARHHDAAAALNAPAAAARGERRHPILSQPGHSRGRPAKRNRPGASRQPARHNPADRRHPAPRARTDELPPTTRRSRCGTADTDQLTTGGTRCEHSDTSRQ